MATRTQIRALGMALVATAFALPAMAQEHGEPGRFPIPESMRAEHAGIHGALEEATRAPDPVGGAARELARVLHPHFVREEQIALPPLALLRPLSEGEFEPWMREVLPMTDSLRVELPRMLREHVEIGAAARRLEQVARQAGNAEVEALAKELQLHARAEEDLFYPAAVLVGDMVLARSRVPRPARTPERE
ncbi:MAG TPA: hemerythrin domain-containing protein [Longimicrobium sp.]|nr:hemerythrin domain-containing protein [Longimicrobium sp.]